LALYQPSLSLTHRKTAKRQGSSSFLKKRTKKLVLDLVRAGRIGRVNRQSKSFLFLFFKKEMLPSLRSVSKAIGIRARSKGYSP
jgi:hypothetical protein